MAKIRNRSMRNAGSFAWNTIKLSMSNTGSLIIGTAGLVVTAVTGGTALGLAAGTVGLAATVNKTTQDFYTFKKEENLQNIYNALNELQDNIMTFKAEIEKHPQIFEMYQTAEQTPSNVNTTLQYRQAAALSNAVSNISSALIGCASSAANIYANPAVITESFGVITAGCVASTGYFIVSEQNRIASKTSTDRVNDSKADLGVETDDVIEIAQLAAALKKQINVLQNSIVQKEVLTPEEFEEKLKAQPQIEPTQYTQKSNGTIAYEALFDIFYPKALKVQEDVQQPIDKVFAKKITSQLQQKLKGNFVDKLGQQEKSNVSTIKGI